MQEGKKWRQLDSGRGGFEDAKYPKKSDCSKKIRKSPILDIAPYTMIWGFNYKNMYLNLWEIHNWGITIHVSIASGNFRAYLPALSSVPLLGLRYYIIIIFGMKF